MRILFLIFGATRHRGERLFSISLGFQEILPICKVGIPCRYTGFVDGKRTVYSVVVRKGKILLLSTPERENKNPN